MAKTLKEFPVSETLDCFDADHLFIHFIIKTRTEDTQLKTFATSAAT